MNTIYTYGYQGGSLADLRQYMAALGARIVDIRYRPYSRLSGWGQRELSKMFAADYLWVQALGNVNYNNSLPMALYYPADGLRRVAALLDQGPVILLCACADWHTCHRRLAGELLAVAAALPLIHLPGRADGVPAADAADTINAISLWQPWASLIHPDYKTRETRSWPAPRSAWEQPLAIHAAKQFQDAERRLYLSDPRFYNVLYALGIHGMRDLPLGAVVAVAVLANCKQVRAYDRATRAVTWTDGSTTVLTEANAAFGDFSPGRWSWNLRTIRRLPAPVPTRGHQGLWRWPVPVDLAPLLADA